MRASDVDDAGAPRPMTILRPGELLGIPAGVPDLLAEVAALRYVLVLLAMAWALLVARTRPWLGLLAGIVFFVIATGFWVAGLGRPYGLLTDPAATRRAAEVTVAGATGGSEGFLVNTEPPGWGAVRLARLGVPPSWLLLAPSFLPLLVPPLVALLVHAWGHPREDAARAALLWLAFGTGHLDAVRGLGLLPELWARPAGAVLFVAAVAALLLAWRWERVRRMWPLAAGLLVLAVTSVPAQPPPGPGAAVLALTLDQSLWLWIGAYGLARGAAGPARALAAAGAATVLLAAAVPAWGLDAWTGHALYRLGLFLAAAGPAGALCGRLGEWLRGGRAWLDVPAERLGLAAVLAAGVPGAFVTWWDPLVMDPVVEESRSVLPAPLTAAADWIRRETPPQAVFVAGPDHAPAVAALGGRRVLRAPTLTTPSDEGERRRLEQRLLEGQTPRRALIRYGITHLFVAPGDNADRGFASPEALASAPYLRLRYRDAKGYRVYEVLMPPALP